MGDAAIDRPHQVEDFSFAESSRECLSQGRIASLTGLVSGEYARWLLSMVETTRRTRTVAFDRFLEARVDLEEGRERARQFVSSQVRY